MNKKFSTLVAALLASGGLFYAVDAMILPASDGVAQAFMTTATRAANGTVTGYQIGVADAATTYAANWTVKAQGAASTYYLAIANAPAGEEWYLASDYTVKKNGTSGAVPADVLALTINSAGGIANSYLKVGANFLTISADGKFSAAATPDVYVGMFDASKAAKTTATANDQVALATIAEGHANLAADAVVGGVTYTSATIGLGSANTFSSWTDASSFAIEEIAKPGDLQSKIKVASIQIGDEKYYLVKSSSAILLETPTAFAAYTSGEADGAVITIDAGTGKVSLGGVTLKVAGGDLTVEGTSTEGEFVYLYTASNGSYVQNLDNIGTGVTYYLANVDTKVKAGDIGTNSATPLKLADETFAVLSTEKKLSNNDLVVADIDKNVIFTINSSNNVTFVGAYKTGYLKADATWQDGQSGSAVVHINSDGLIVDADGKVLCLNSDALAFFATSAPSYAGATKLSAYPVTTTGATQTIGAQAVNSLESGAQYVFAALGTAAATPSQVVTTTAQEFETGSTGSIYGEIAGVQIAENGAITISSSVEELIVPVHIKNAQDVFLSVVDGKAVWKNDPSKSATVYAASWVLDNGALKCIDQENAGVDEIWFNGVGNELIAKQGKATDVAFTAAGITIGTTPTVASLSYSTSTAPAVRFDEINNPLLAAASGYIILGDGVNFISDATGATVTDPKDAQLWAVTATKRTDGRYEYHFQTRESVGEKTPVYLAVNGAKDFIGSYANGVMLQVSNGNNNANVVLNGGQLDLNQTAPAVNLGFYRSCVIPFNAEYLLHRNGSNFNLMLKDKANGTADLKSNPFAEAELIPMVWNATDKKLEVADNTNDYYLLKKGDNYIVLDLDKKNSWGNIYKEVEDGGYKFAVLTEANMIKLMKGTLTSGSYAPYFRINYLQGTTEYDSKTIDKLGDNQGILSVQASQSGDFTDAYNFVTFEVDNTVYLTVDKFEKAWTDLSAQLVYASFKAENLSVNLVHGNSTSSPLSMQYVNISFAHNSDVYFSNEKRENVKLNGKVLGMRKYTAAAGYSAIPVDAANALSAKPEGQWLVKMTNLLDATDKQLKDGVELNKDNDTQFTFINRESGATYKVERMHYMGDSKYAVEYSSNATTFGYTLDEKNQPVSVARDTIIIKPAYTAKELEKISDMVNMDGYANLKAAEVQDKVYHLSVANNLVEAYVTENHSKDDHFLGLDKEVSNAVNWRLVPLTATRGFGDDKILKTATDSVYQINKPMYHLGSSKYSQHIDTTAIISYALQNTDNNEFLTYDPSQSATIKSMICDPNFKKFETTKDVTSAYRFVLKEKANGQFNIIGVNYTTYDDKGYYKDNIYATLDLSKKLYGANTYNKNGAVEVESAYEQMNSNDLFNVTPVNAQEYRKLTQGEVIRLFRAENDNDVIYENGEFLNIGNIAQLKDMAPALYVDTAYVERDGNNRYQYLLAVNTDYVPATFDNKDHLITPDTLYGRFLVNLIDSAVVEYQNGAIHNNKYINDKEADETYVKTGFVWGYRTNDQLFLTEGKNFKKVKDIISLSSADFTIAKFAFRHVNPATEGDKSNFKIQTRYVDYNSAIKSVKNESNEGYLKTINGVVVVTNSYAKGEEFNLAAEESAPTANEGINTSEVSVVAKEGEVVINGAAGKTVVITNVLGQTIANTVLSSDNATIAAPAGVVVVAVEGESAVKAIVK